MLFYYSFGSLLAFLAPIPTLGRASLQLQFWSVVSRTLVHIFFFFAKPKMLNYQACIEHPPLPVFLTVTNVTSCSSEGEPSLTSYTEFLTPSDRSLTCDSGENHILKIIPGHSPPWPHIHTISPELPELYLLQSIMCIWPSGCKVQLIPTVQQKFS